MRNEEGPKSEMSAEEYEDLLKISLTDVGDDELNHPGTLLFSVTPGLTIFITKKSHGYLSDQYGVDLDKTFTEGYITINKDGISEIIFKTDEYQPARGFHGTNEEFNSLKLAVRRKIEKLFD